MTFRSSATAAVRLALFCVPNTGSGGVGAFSLTRQCLSTSFATKQTEMNMHYEVTLAEPSPSICT
ncbi:hypothetical protein PR003_g13660 [Phytophthora rubi]|uniref:Uncharacterized protein n=1 Tax=Phytophthora rubi TaxID=129364 RepID=A0A6A4EWT0_9STRA|nr:hypothetical protein PR002_g13186 [Phytophthora rubi]KAE9039731.1 hypothetical protein PR001_g7385 [Phytophthora rubi]KAE9334148.1 hypothetical protein PR003_g13660 [Phytophthora rubi]